MNLPRAAPIPQTLRSTSHETRRAAGFPPSSLFFVWSQQREAELDAANFDVARQLGRAYADPGRHVFLIKYSRWMGR